MKKYPFVKLVLAILLVAALSGCSLGQEAPTATDDVKQQAAEIAAAAVATMNALTPETRLTPTLDFENAVGTTVAETMAAMGESEPTARPTSTKVPTLPAPTATLAAVSTAAPARSGNTWGWAEQIVVPEDGAWTAHQGFESCVNDPLCWELTGDTQFKLVQTNSTIDCDAGNSVLVAAWDGDYSWNGGELHIKGEDEVGQFVLFICPSDANIPIQARINASFALVTDLPARQVLQGYLDQNIESMFGGDNCNGDGCDEAVIFTIVNTESNESWTGMVQEPYGSWTVK